MLKRTTKKRDPAVEVVLKCPSKPNFGSAVDFTYPPPNTWHPSCTTTANVGTPDSCRCLSSVSVVSRVSFSFSLTTSLKKDKSSWREMSFQKKKKKINKMTSKSCRFQDGCCVCLLVWQTRPHPSSDTCGFAAGHETCDKWNFSDIYEKDNCVTRRQVEYMDSHTLKNEPSRLSAIHHGNFKRLAFTISICCCVHAPYNNQQR